MKEEGPGLIDCHLYEQPRRLVLHLVNLTNSGAWPAPLHELVPVGPLRVRVQEKEAGLKVRLLVSGESVESSSGDGWLGFEISVVKDHEVVLL